MRDTVSNVPIDVILAGEFPEDGKAKPVSFPDPALESQQQEGLSLLPIFRPIELGPEIT